MIGNQRKQSVSEINSALQIGKLNEAYRIASKNISFHIEELDFVRLLGITLDRLGFIEESNSVLNFASNLENHRLSQADKSIGDNEQAKDHGYSVGYEIKGTHSDWNNPVWEIRARYLARQLQNEECILDLGCGNMLIEKYLSKHTRYVPCDIRSRDERTIVCDFNDLEFPGDQGESYVICIGVLNYLNKPGELVNHICSRNKPFYLSYKPKELIEYKINKAIFPDTLSTPEIVEIINAHNLECRYTFLLGQGDEILLIGTPRQ